MTEAVLNFPNTVVPKRHELKLDKSFKVAVGDYLRQRWPSGTAKAACKAFRGLSLDQAKKAVGYDCSFTTLELIVKRGGPSVAVPIIEAVMGENIVRFIIEQRKQHEANARRLGALVGDLWPVAADPDAGGPGVADGEGQRGRPERRRGAEAQTRRAS